eukprot:12076-Heterococcus_DN1.PRE.1
MKCGIDLMNRGINLNDLHAIAQKQRSAVSGHLCTSCFLLTYNVERKLSIASVATLPIIAVAPQCSTCTDCNVNDDSTTLRTTQVVELSVRNAAPSAVAGAELKLALRPTNTVTVATADPKKRMRLLETAARLDCSGVLTSLSRLPRPPGDMQRETAGHYSECCAVSCKSEIVVAWSHCHDPNDG